MLGIVLAVVANPGLSRQPLESLPVKHGDVTGSLALLPSQDCCGGGGECGSVGRATLSSGKQVLLGLQGLAVTL